MTTDQGFFIVTCVALLVIITSIDKNKLLSKSKTVIDSLNYSAPFCTLSCLMIQLHIRTFIVVLYRSCYSLHYCLNLLKVQYFKVCHQAKGKIKSYDVNQYPHLISINTNTNN